MFYRIALIDSIAPVPGCQGWECYEALKLAGHAVEVVDPKLHPGLVDEAGSLDEAQLARFREVFAPDYVAWKGESAEEILGSLSARGVLGSASRARHFVVFGYVGPGNFGDELIFDTLCRQVRRRYPGAYVSLIGHRPPASLARHGVASTTPDVKVDVDRMLNGADALVFMAGIMFDEPFLDTAGRIDLFLNPHSEIAGQTATTLAAYLNGVPAVYLGIGAGPLAHPDSQALVRLASLTEPLYVPRDQETCALLRAAGVEERLIHGKADLAFLVEPPGACGSMAAALEANGVAEGAYAVVALRRCSGQPEGMAEAVARGLDALVETKGLRPVLVDFAPEDREIHQEVRSLMVHGEQAVSFDRLLDQQEVLWLLSHGRVALAMRLHCSILANSFGVPSVGLDYNDKVRAYYAQMGRPHALLGLGVGGDEVTRALEAALAEGVAGQELAAATARNRRHAAEAMGLLWEVVEGREAHPSPQYVYPRADSLAALRLADAENQLAATLADLDEARCELSALRRSTAWRVGRVLTWPLRKLKDVLR